MELDDPQIISAVIGAIVGAIAGIVPTYFVSRKLYKEQRSVRKLRCRPTYCQDLFTDGTGPWEQSLVLTIGGELLCDPVIANFAIDHIGNDIAKDITILIATRKEDQMVRAQVLLPNELQYERIETKEQTRSRLKYKISYMNPGDTVIVAVLVSPCVEAECMTVHIEGEGVEVTQVPMSMDCRAQMPNTFVSIHE